jgi:hypothetical protein
MLQQFVKFELKQKTTKATQTGLHTATDQWVQDHVSCHVSVDWSKSRPRPGAHNGRRIRQRRRDSGDQRACDGASAILRNTGSLQVVAPLTFGRRRLHGGKAERRSSQVHDDGAVQRAREVAKQSMRCRSSP